MKRGLSEIGSGEEASLWVKRKSSKGAFYWQNQLTGKSVWEEPADSQAPLVKQSTEAAKWTEKYSTTHKRPYWYNELDGTSVWEDPRKAPTLPSKPSRESRIASIKQELEREWQTAAVDAPNCPRCSKDVDLPTLVSRLREENAVVEQQREFKAVFTLYDDDTAMITRAIQEDQILKTKLKLKEYGKAVDLPSFWDVWFDKSGALQKAILSSKDPNEAKWTNMRPFRYKLATTFMPGYAKALFDYFGAKTVLDPCSGWGDRLTGACATAGVTKYVGFDPNRSLRPGYAKLLKLFGHDCVNRTDKMLSFSNGFEVRAQPFEVNKTSSSRCMCVCVCVCEREREREKERECV